MYNMMFYKSFTVDLYDVLVPYYVYYYAETLKKPYESGYNNIIDMYLSENVICVPLDP